jgi:hypothetical protein
VRITPKAEQGSLTTLQSTTAQSPRQSFFNTLASVSSSPVQRANATHSEARDNSEERSNDSKHDQDQSQNSSSIQSQKNSRASNQAQKRESASQSTQQVDSKTGQSEDKATSAKSSENTSDRNADKTSSNTAAFTAQVASPFVLQASTAQPIDAQSSSAVSGQGSDLQREPGVTGPILLADAQNSRAEQGSAAEQAFGVLRAARSAAGQVEMGSASTDQLSDSTSTTSGDAQLPTANGASDASGMASFDPTIMLQASLAAETQMGSAVKSSDGNVNQPSVKAIQSKVAGSTFGLNASTGDANKTATSDDASNGLTTGHSADIASVQTLSTESGGAHLPGVETKGVDAIALQPVVAATQTESRGASGSHTTSGSTDTSAHRGSESGDLTSQQWVGSESAGMSGISVARLIQTMGATEMRVGMHSSEFGDISIRTSVAQQQMQTQISVDHSELGNALSAHIPNMQAKLGSEYGLHATIEVNQSGASFSSDGDRSQQHQQKATVGRVEAVEGPVVLQNDMIGLRGSVVTTGEYRLDIRA